MERVTFRFSISDLGLTVDRIGRLMDYDRGEDDGMTAMMIEEALHEAENHCDIRSEYIICKEVKDHKWKENILVNGIDFSLGKTVSAELRNATSMAVFLCTAGQWIGEHARKLIAEKDFLKGYIFDLTGSEIADAAADLMQDKLKTRMEKDNLKITNRYSPGYCGWHVSEQQKLFRLVPENFCRITLLPSSLMNPIKSVSGFIGIGEKVRYNPYTCSACDMEHCQYKHYKNL